MKKGTIIMLCGLPGSGKTTRAKQLEEDREAIRFCPDEWILTLVPGQANVPEQDKLREPVEKLMLQTALRLAALGVTVVLENGFWVQSERDIYRDIAKKAGAEIEIVYLEVSFEDLWKRLQKRNKNLPDGTYEIPLEKLKEWYQLFEPPTQEELYTYHAAEVIGQSADLQSELQEKILN